MGYFPRDATLQNVTIDFVYTFVLCVSVTGFLFLACDRYLPYGLEAIMIEQVQVSSLHGTMNKRDAVLMQHVDATSSCGFLPSATIESRWLSLALRWLLQ